MAAQTDESRVRAAMSEVSRADFLPPDQVRFADLDRPLPIGHGQTNSQPTTVRHMLLLLDAQPGHRVLDVGCGSGWTTALLAELTHPGGEVLGVELVPELTEAARAAVSAHGGAGVRVEQAEEGVLGRPGDAPYDRILVSAEADRVPRQLLEQLAPGGVMVLPVRGRLVEVRRPQDPSTEPEVRRHGHYSFVPLLGPTR
jgi:protein-L-isoaspartate(D-aspartate) O-methyltransferase